MSGKNVVQKGAKSATVKKYVPPFLKTYIKSGEAVAAPPLGPALGARNIQIGPFCKQFNEMTKDYKPGIPLKTLIELNPDRSITIRINKPTVSYLLRQAAGCKKGRINKDDVAGKVTLKHVYEIAKIKKEEYVMRGYTMEQMCKSVIGTAHTMGIQIVRTLDTEEYQEFLRERELRLAEHEKELEETRQARLLRL